MKLHEANCEGLLSKVSDYTLLSAVPYITLKIIEIQHVKLKLLATEFIIIQYRLFSTDL